MQKNVDFHKSEDLQTFWIEFGQFDKVNELLLSSQRLKMEMSLQSRDQKWYSIVTKNQHNHAALNSQMIKCVQLQCNTIWRILTRKKAYCEL